MYSAATAARTFLSSAAPSFALDPACHLGGVKGMGVRWVRQIDRTYDVARCSRQR